MNWQGGGREVSFSKALAATVDVEIGNFNWFGLVWWMLVHAEKRQDAVCVALTDQLYIGSKLHCRRRRPMPCISCFFQKRASTHSD